MAHILLKNIQKRWGNIYGVRDVNINIADEEFIVFLGPSGCGKTTTMRMIAGLEDPTEGEVLMDDIVMNDVDARDRDVAMVFQGYALYPNMSIYENIRFPLRMRGVPREEHDKRVREAAELVELVEYLDRKPAALSGGNGSVQRWRGRSCGSPGCSSWTNLCPILTPSCARPCGSRSSTFSAS